VRHIISNGVEKGDKTGWIKQNICAIYLNDNTGFSNLIRGGDMRLLRLAVKQERWDLAAHTIVLATARQLKNGEKRNDRRSQAKKKNVKA
jgi:hypothetical protein